MLHDIRSAVRHLVRQPRFALGAILTLAIGIGANVAVFAVVDGVLLRALPYPNPGALVRIWEDNPSRGIVHSNVSRGNFADWRTQLTSFAAIESFAGLRDTMVQFGGARDPEIARDAGVTDGFMAMLGARPILGSLSHPGVALSYEYWQRRFGGDPSVVGRTVVFEGSTQHPGHIAAVMPRGFDFPTGADLWTTMSFGRERADRTVHVLARLKPGVTLEQARAEMVTMSARLARAYPAENAGWRAEIQPFQTTLVGDLRPRLLLLYVGVSLVLLIAIVNVGVLFLARSAARRRELSIRLALGASLWRIGRQTLVECVVLAAAGGIAGSALAAAVIRMILTAVSASVPRLTEIGMNESLIGASIAIAAATAVVLMGVSTIGMRLSPAPLRRAVDETADRRPHARTVLFAAEVACCVCLLAVAADAIGNFVRLERAPLGFDPAHVLTIEVRQPIIKPGEVVKHYPTRRFLRTAEAITSLAARLPGVTAAGLSLYAPVAHQNPIATYRHLNGASIGPLTGAPDVTGPGVRQASLAIVDAGFFEAMHVPILRGRAFTREDRLNDRQIDDFDADRGAGAAIVSESLARRDWPVASAVGRHLAIDEAAYRSVMVVGVAGDVVDAPGDAPQPTVYLPYAQDPHDRFTLLVRVAGAPQVLAAPLRERLRQFGTDVAAFDVQTMDETVGAAIAGPRFTSAVMGSFGTIAIMFSAIGLYTVLSFFVALRKRELAIRLAIGADPRRLVRWVVTRGLRVSGAGIAAGLLMSLGLTRALRSAIPDFAASSIWLVIVPVLVLITAAVASYLPARRAGRVDPVRVLRE